MTTPDSADRQGGAGDEGPQEQGPMKQPGNGSSRFEIGQHDMGGWVRIVAAGSLPEDVGMYLSHTLAEWFRQRPQYRLTCVVPINRDGTTVELHGFFECHVFQPTAEAPRPVE
jgi:hypothetical protein